MAGAIFQSEDGVLIAISIVSVVVVIGMLLAYRAHRRDPKTRRTRVGVYIERDMFKNEEENKEEDEQ